jgi:phenylalanyl-tRNA synthetase beta chain
VNRLLGTTLPEEEQRALLARVGIETEEAGGNERIPVALQPQPLGVDPEPDTALAAIVPTWRRDIAIEADVAEEVARVLGYELVPSVTPDTEMPRFRASPLEVRDLVRETLAGAGLSEIVTTALVSPRHVEGAALVRPVPSVGDEPQPAPDPIGVTNPLSRDHAVLRRNLLGSLLDVVGTNLRHGMEDVAVFEVGKGYGREGDDADEWWRLGIALVGAAEPASWNRPERPYDLDDAKGLVELIARRLDLPRPTYLAEREEPAFHPGRTARVQAGGRMAGIVGEAHPSLVEAWELRTGRRVVLAELAIEGLAGGRLAPERAPSVGRFPEVDRDLAIVVPEATPAAVVDALVRARGGALLRDVRLFDIYRGVPLAAGEKSLAERLRFGADRTLTEPEVEAAIAAIVAALPSIGGRLRA